MPQGTLAALPSRSSTSVGGRATRGAARGRVAEIFVRKEVRAAHNEEILTIFSLRAPDGCPDRSGD